MSEFQATAKKMVKKL